MSANSPMAPAFLDHVREIAYTPMSTESLGRVEDLLADGVIHACREYLRHWGELPKRPPRKLTAIPRE